MVLPHLAGMKCLIAAHLPSNETFGDVLDRLIEYNK